VGRRVWPTPPSVRQQATKISLGQSVTPDLQIVAFLLAKTFHRWPWEIDTEPADQVIQAWQLLNDLEPKERR
jgi:hypothetical protein